MQGVYNASTLVVRIDQYCSDMLPCVLHLWLNWVITWYIEFDQDQLDTSPHIGYLVCWLTAVCLIVSCARWWQIMKNWSVWCRIRQQNVNNLFPVVKADAGTLKKRKNWIHLTVLDGKLIIYCNNKWLNLFLTIMSNLHWNPPFYTNYTYLQVLSLKSLILLKEKPLFCIYGHKNWVDQFLYNIEVKGENLHLKFAYIYALLNAIPIRYSKLNGFNFPYLFKSRAILSSSQIMSLPEL